MKIAKFDPLIFPFRLWIVKNPDESKLRKQFIYYKERTPFLHEPTIGSTDIPYTAYTSALVEELSSTNVGVLIAIGEDEMLPMYIAHEACHAAGILYDYIGEISIPIQSESHAYFIQWIVECIHKSIENGK